MRLLLDTDAIIDFLKHENDLNKTITLSRSAKLKLPDAIIGATAIVYDAKLVTRDPHFLKCQYKKLLIWDNA